MRAGRAPRNPPRRALCRPSFSPLRPFDLLVTCFALCLTAGAFAEPFFLPTGDEVFNTGDPRVRADAAGGLHLVYPLVAATGAAYSYCPPGCDGPEEMATVVFHTDDFGAVSNALVALDSAGAPRVLLATHQSVFYGECSGDCRYGGSWSLMEIYAHDGNWELTGEAFALDQNGRPRFLMHAEQTYLGLFAPDPGTAFFSCDADCLDFGNWRRGRRRRTSPPSSHWRTRSSSRTSRAASTAAPRTSTTGPASASATLSTTCTSRRSNRP